MPNWCFNSLTVHGPARELRAFMEAAACPATDESPAQPFSAQALRPMPEETALRNYDAPNGGYQWELKYWGCKWGISDAELRLELANRALFTFDTAWSPPTELIRFVAAAHPELTFTLTYEEGGNGFQGFRMFRAQHHLGGCDEEYTNYLDEEEDEPETGEGGAGAESSSASED